MAWIPDKITLSVKVDNESTLGKIHELEKIHEMLGRTIAELKAGIQTEEPAKEQAQ